MMKSIHLLACLAGLASANFVQKFTNITHGTPVLMVWEEIKPENLPVFIQVLMYSGSQAKGYDVVMNNLTEGFSGTSFLWDNTPSPLPYDPTAKYEVQILPHKRIIDGMSITLADSGLFDIHEQGTLPINMPDKSPSTNSGSGDGAITSGDPVNKLVLGIALGVTLPSIFALTVLGWVFWKRRVKIVEEKRRRRRIETIIH